MEPARTAYRIGIDGSGVVPPIPTVTSPVVIGTPFAGSLAYQPDPAISTGYSHNIDFTGTPDRRDCVHSRDADQQRPGAPLG